MNSPLQSSTDMSEPVVKVDVDSRGVANITLNRPEVNNAYNDDMLEGLLEGVLRLGADDEVRILVLRGEGRYFQAGADLKFMGALADRSFEDNLHISRVTTDLFRYLDQCPKPTVAIVQGGAFGGGVGLLTACDVVVAAENARFAITEVRWGLVVGPILPALGAAIGVRNTRRYALSAEPFDAPRAYEMGLVHELCAAEDLERTAGSIVERFLQCSPTAIAESKAVMFQTLGQVMDDAMAARLSLEHAERRRSEEGAEGLASFREKRQAAWYPGPPE